MLLLCECKEKKRRTSKRNDSGEQKKPKKGFSSPLLPTLLSLSLGLSYKKKTHLGGLAGLRGGFARLVLLGVVLLFGRWGEEGMKRKRKREREREREGGREGSERWGGDGGDAARRVAQKK